jgi:hypothetical protein
MYEASKALTSPLPVTSAGSAESGGSAMRPAASRSTNEASNALMPPSPVTSPYRTRVTSTLPSDRSAAGLPSLNRKLLHASGEVPSLRYSTSRLSSVPAPVSGCVPVAETVISPGVSVFS